MSKFLARVELHDVDADDDAYVTLHAAMKERGFRRWLKAGDGAHLRLPPGTYILKKGSAVASTVVDLANDAIAATGHDGSVVVADAFRISSSGLKPKKKQAA